jgi:hypothetical protein
MTVRDQLVTAARADLAWLERRHKRWEAECEARHAPRDPWWLEYSQREMAPVLLRLEGLLEVDVRDLAVATV